MKGFVPTPEVTVDAMVSRLFRDRPPQPHDRLLDPGCGYGAFLEGVIRWCHARQVTPPEMIGIDLDPSKIREARRRLNKESQVTLHQGDFLARDLGRFDYVIGNPPYVPIDALSEDERLRYRASFSCAVGRVDLYLLFWERCVQILRDAGRAILITPEKFTYVESARPLRKLLTATQIEDLQYVAEDTFPGFVTYPLITAIKKVKAAATTRVQLRNGQTVDVQLPSDGSSWQPAIHGSPVIDSTVTLESLSLRVSCGVATGADKTFLFDFEALPEEYAHLIRPAISGRELRPGHELPRPRRGLLMPYDDEGELLCLSQLGSAANYLRRCDVRARLEARTCARRKPWYAFHETPPLAQMLVPKIICKDIAREPYFWIDESGTLVPLHSTYYVVPVSQDLLAPLAEYLNSEIAKRWLRANCQRAANGFLRMQSAVLKRLPVPDRVWSECRDSKAA